MSAPRPPKTPRWVHWALCRLLSDQERQGVLDELAELYAAWLTRLGRREADRRYRRQLRHYPILLLAHTLRSRAHLPVPGLREMGRATRSLLRAPSLAVIIVLTVGIGIGGCTTIFAVVDALYLRALPYPDGNRIQVLYSQEGDNHWALSTVDVQALQTEATAFSKLAAYARSTRTFVDGAAAQRLTTYATSPDFLDVLGIKLLSGRRPTREEAAPGAPQTAVVTLGFARTYLGSTRPDGSDVLGRSIRLDGEPHQVLGVMPSDFGPLARTAQVFVTLQLAPPTRKGPFFMFAVARLREGVSPEAARQQLHDITRRLYPVWASSFQDEKATWGMQPIGENLQGDSGRLIGILMGAGILVLLIATANAAGLLLARVTSRGTELAVRAALGASRSRVVGHLLAESAVLAVAGGLVGLGAARAGVAVLPLVASAYLPRLDEVSLSGPVLGFALLLAAASGLAFGFVPALRHRADARMAADLRQGGRGATHGPQGRRIQRALVVAQLAVTTPLLAGAGLLLSSLARLQNVDPGFDPAHVVSLRVSLPSASYPDDSDRTGFWTDALRQVAALPGVVSVGLSDARPPDDHQVDNNFDLEDHPSGAGSQPVVPWIAADSGFFRTLQIPLLAGRMLEPRDAGAADPVVLVDQAWARRFFPGQSAVGRRMRNGGDTQGPWTTVVGVVGDVSMSGLARADEGVVYFPDVESWARQPYLYVRTSGDPTRAVAAVRDAIRGLDPGVPVTDVATADAALRDSLARPRNLTLVISLFSVVALGLAVLGLYGVMAYGVQQRRGDIAVRLTLGGNPRQVLAMVTGEGMALAGIGLALGLAASLLLTRTISTLLYGVTPRDPVALAGASLLLLAVSAMACLVPAIRAVRVSPAAVLREE